VNEPDPVDVALEVPPADSEPVATVISGMKLAFDSERKQQAPHVFEEFLAHRRDDYLPFLGGDRAFAIDVRFYKLTLDFC